MASTTPPDVAARVEASIRRFKLTRLLSQDQAGRRITLLGTIDDLPALLLAERAAFAVDNAYLSSFPTSLSRIKNLGANDVYAWFLANRAFPSSSYPSHGEKDEGEEGEDGDAFHAPDFKLSLIHPCTPKHVAKYTPAPLRLVTETPAVYAAYIRPWIAAQRAPPALAWIANILAGTSEQDDVLHRNADPQRGFVLLPDLNWDRKSVAGLHLLVLVARSDVWSMRDLQHGDAAWLRGLSADVRRTVGELYGVDEDQVKLYVHYQPTYHHFHVHVVHVQAEAGATQAVGKAVLLESVVGMLEAVGEGRGMADVSVAYTVSEGSGIWDKVWGVLKDGGVPDVSKF